MADFDNDDGGDAGQGGEKAQKKSGVRKDGKPYKDGNTREDGSYQIGKYRPDRTRQFGPGNQAAKGRKGSKNLLGMMEKALRQKMTIDGRKQSAQEWVIEGLIRRGIKKSDRAAQIILDMAAQLERAKSQKRRSTDTEVLDQWLAERLAELSGTISDDADGPVEDPPCAASDDADSARTTPEPGGDDAHDENDDADQ